MSKTFRWKRIFSGAMPMVALVGCWALKPADAAPKPWGVYQIYWGEKKFRQGLEQQITLLGKVPDYVMFFRDMVRPFPTETAKYLDSLGAIPIISLELTIWGRDKALKGRVLDQILKGKYDAYFRAWAKGARDYGKPVIYRFGFEMNGNWFVWGAQPEKFKKTWRHVHQIFREEKAANVQWMFNPSVLWEKKKPEEHFYVYYPGDSTVDLVGLDGYNFGDHHSKYHRWETPEEVFEPSVAAMMEFNKPLLIGEVGCADDPRKAAWMRDFLQWVSEEKRVEAFIYFNYDKRSEGESNWRIESHPKSLEEFRKWAGGDKSGRH